MKNTSLGSWVGLAVLVVSAAVPPIAGCSSDDTSPAAGSAGAAGTAGSGGSTVDAGGGSAGGPEGGVPDAPKESGGGSAGAGGDTGGSGGGGNDPFANPAFTGIDTSGVPAGTPPTGCQEGLDSATGKLVLTLTPQVPSLLIGVVDGEIRANGVVCAAANGAKATPENTSSIWISGSDADETVIVDLSTGSFGPKIGSKEGGIHVDLAGGKDVAAIRGTTDKDTIRAGKSTTQIAVDLTGDSSADLLIGGAEELVTSLGPGADEFRAGSDSGFDGPVDIPLVVAGDADDDTIEGGNGNDKLNGGDGEDLFDEGDASNGSDTINGGPNGNNTITYERRTGDLTVTLCVASSAQGCPAPDCDCVADDGQQDEKDNVINVHHFIAGSGSDTVTGTLKNDVIEGRDGPDFLYGMDGEDSLKGEEGEDTLDGGPDADDLDCGEGDSDIAVTDTSDTINNCELY